MVRRPETLLPSISRIPGNRTTLDVDRRRKSVTTYLIRRTPKSSRGTPASSPNSSRGTPRQVCRIRRAHPVSLDGAANRNARDNTVRPHGTVQRHGRSFQTERARIDPDDVVRTWLTDTRRRVSSFQRGHVVIRPFSVLTHRPSPFTRFFCVDVMAKSRNMLCIVDGCPTRTASRKNGRYPSVTKFSLPKNPSR